MKKILLLFLFVQNLYAQEWQTIPKEYFGMSVLDLKHESTLVNKAFKINPYTNDLWLSYYTNIHHIDNAGQYELFTIENTPAFDFPAYSFLDFEFTSDAVFTSRFFSGMYQFSNNIWEHVVPNLKSNFLSSDKDTIWISQSNNENFYKYYDGILENGNQPYFRRTANKNGAFWSSSANSAFIDYFYNGQPFTYDPDTCGLMSINNYNFKFSKYTDSMYVASEKGLSIAYQRKFIDSIDQFSSFNMPSNPSILEFEFDNKDNIWALYGEQSLAGQLSNNGIAYYDQSTKTWSNYYDATNSPIDFTQLLTIEVDTAGNLWVAERDKLHVLKINETPAWLAAPELQNPVAVDLYPNPGTEKLHVRFKQEVMQAQSLKLRNVMGQLVLEQEMHSGEQNYEFSTTTLPQGIYFLDLGAQKQWRKWIKL